MSIDALLSVLVYVCIIGLIFWVVWWAIGAIGVPEPFNKVIRVILVLVAALFAISILLGLVGHPLIAPIHLGR